MPLWKIYHPEDAFDESDKRALSERITALYNRLPRFYVGVIFQPVADHSFYVGGEPRRDFVRIWIDHIARTLPDADMRTRWIALCDEALAPFIKERGFSWEYHIDETSHELWSIEGFRPPLAGTADEARWIQENRPSPVLPR
ncbi:tautomerase family protein [Sphingobium sp. 3R8]|uniref:tautomerase family protein n=1 Tax=Sphingobium sp. 3R8 TaxID=2874921 RepID=UPI001CD01F41|nr:tautomerase family protein [Sphingobium sp. 3R8]MBZ9650257.1 tautomerase family protein [Sphingobium sp. 3R8]